MQHKKFSTRAGLLFVISLILALILAPASAFGQAAGTNSNAAVGNAAGETTSIVISPAQQKAALDFWTRDRIAAAKPMAMLSLTNPETADSAAAPEQEAVMGMPGFSASGLAAANADEVARAAFAEDWRAATSLAAPQAPDGTSQTYTSYVVNQWQPAQTIYPHKWIGRLSFRTPSGTSYCSATSISGNVMLTAAHCLYDSTNNRWYSNWVFTPAYRNGNAPYGNFAATTCWVLTNWINLAGGFNINTWTRYDVGVCKMGKNAAGQTMNTAVGWMGRQWNYGYVRNYFNLGYPFRDYRDYAITDAGLYLRTCTAESFQQTTDTMGMGCNWSRGISGGPWMTAYAPPLVSGYANGVNSGFYIGTQNLYSIRFTGNNIVPLCTAAGC